MPLNFIPIGDIFAYPEPHDAHVRAFDQHLWHLINDKDYAKEYGFKGLLYS